VITTSQGRRWRLRRLLASAFALVALAVTGLAVGAAPASAASSVGGSIARSEILQRAQAWYSICYQSVTQCDANGMHYDMSGTHIDPTGSRSYRRDCSGFIDMAWHLASDPNTGGLADSTYTTPISRDSLLPGDLLDDDVKSASEGTNYPYHAILFAGWVTSDKKSFWYYSYGGTPITKRTANMSDATLPLGSHHPMSDYKALRYKKTVADSWPAMTTICSYRVATAFTDRVGPGTSFPYDKHQGASKAAGVTIGAGEDGAVIVNGVEWRHIADSLGADQNGGWVQASSLTWINSGTCD
jgi:hypothetical protein